MVTEAWRQRQLYATEAAWQAENPVLLEGEIALSYDVKKYKVGPGAWATLSYWDAGGLPDAPSDGFVYGLKDDQWTKGPELTSSYSGSLNSIPNAHVKFVRLDEPISGGWSGSKTGDHVLHMHDPVTDNIVQIGYGHTENSDGESVVHTRVKRGSTWTQWISNTMFGDSAYVGSLTSLAGGSGAYNSVGHIGSGASSGWPGMAAGDIINVVNIDGDSARIIGYSSGEDQADYGIWMNRKTGGTWGSWYRPQIEVDDITDLWENVYSKSEVNAAFVNVIGDTMTGRLTLSADPVNPMHAATKQYVDSGVESPDERYVYGKKGDAWTPAPEYEPSYSGDLDNISDEYVKFVQLKGTLTNGWTGVSDGDHVLHLYDDGTGSTVQVGYSHSAAGEGHAVIHTRARRGSAWTDWVTNSMFSDTQYGSSLTALSNSSLPYNLTVFVSASATEGWSGMSAGDIVQVVNLDEDSAQMIGYSTGVSKADVQIWLRRKENGLWGNWNRPQISVDDITDLWDWVYSKVEINTFLGNIQTQIDNHLADLDNPHEVTWSQLSDKPTEFPPAYHTHAEADITDLDKFGRNEAEGHFIIKDGLTVDPATVPGGPTIWMPLDYDTVDNPLVMTAGSPLVSLGIGGQEPHFGWGGSDYENPWNRLTSLDQAADASMYFGMKFDGMDYVTTKDNTFGASAFLMEYDSTSPSMNFVLSYPQGGGPTNPIQVPIGTELPVTQVYSFNGNGSGDNDVLRLKDQKGYFLKLSGTDEDGDMSGPIGFSLPSGSTKQPFLEMAGNNASWEWSLAGSTGEIRFTQDGNLLYQMETTFSNRNSLPSNGSIVTRVSGDNRYAQVIHTHVEDDITDLDRMRMRSPYVFGTQYSKNDVVLDGSWTMVANKDTSDRAAPQKDGDETWDMVEIPSWTTGTHAGLVRTGREYTTSEAITLVGYEVWVPELGTDIDYRIKIFAYPEGRQEDVVYEEISDLSFVEGAWTTVRASQALIASGTVFGIFLEAINSSSETVFDGAWANGGEKIDPDEAPPANSWGRTKFESFNFDVTDLNTTNYVDELMAVVPGSRILIEQTDNINLNWEIAINAFPTAYDATGTVVPGPDYSTAAWVSFETDQISGDTGPQLGSTTTCTFTVPVAIATEYVIIPSGNPTHSWGTSVGNLWYDGVSQPGTEVNAYGVRVLVDTWTQSLDWDILSALGSGTSGGSGSTSGVNKFSDLIDTPANYVGNAGKLVKVNNDETGLEYLEGTGISLIPILTDDTKAQVGGGVDPEQATVALNNTDYVTFTGNVGSVNQWDQPNNSSNMVRVDSTNSVVVGFDQVLYTYIGPREVYLGLYFPGHVKEPGTEHYAYHDVTTAELVVITTSAHGLLGGLYYNIDGEPGSGISDDHPQYYNSERANNPVTGFLRLSGGTMNGQVDWISGGEKVVIGNNGDNDAAGIAFTGENNEYGGGISTGNQTDLNSSWEFVPFGDDGNSGHEYQWQHRLYFNDSSKKWGIRQGSASSDYVGNMNFDEIMTKSSSEGSFVPIDGTVPMTGGLDIGGVSHPLRLMRQTGSTIRIAFDADTFGNEVAFFEWDNTLNTFDFYTHVEGGNSGRIEPDPNSPAAAPSTLMTWSKGAQAYWLRDRTNTTILGDLSLSGESDFYGFYRTNNNTLNMPSQATVGTNTVLNASATDTITTQFLGDVRKDVLWVRHQDSGTWGDWSRIITSDGEQDLWVLKTGDTMTGDLMMSGAGARIGIGRTPEHQLDIQQIVDNQALRISSDVETFAMSFASHSAANSMFKMSYGGTNGTDIAINDQGDLFLAADGSDGNVRIGGSGFALPGQPGDFNVKLDVSGTARAWQLLLSEQGGVDAEVTFAPAAPKTAVMGVSERYQAGVVDDGSGRSADYFQMRAVGAGPGLNELGRMYQATMRSIVGLEGKPGVGKHEWFFGASQTVAAMDYTTFGAGGDLPSGSSIVTRERGDTRYLVINDPSNVDLQKVIYDYVTIRSSGGDELDLHGAYVKFPNIEPTGIPELNGAVGFDSSHGLKIFRNWQPGDANGDGLYTILDSSNIAGTGGITITGGGPDEVIPITFNFDPDNASWLNNRFVELAGGTEVLTTNGPTTFTQNALLVSNNNTVSNTAIAFQNTSAATGDGNASMAIARDGDLVFYVGPDHATGTASARISSTIGTLNNEIDLVTREKGDARYLALSGGTMTGRLLFDVEGYANSPVIDFSDVFGGAGTGFWPHPETNALRYGYNGVGAVFFEPAGEDVNYDQTSITREKGDARYLRLIGGTVVGDVTMDRTGSAAGVYFTLRSDADKTSAMQIADINGDDRGVVRRLAGTNTLQVGNGFMDNHLIGSWTTQYRLTNEGGEVTLDSPGDYVTRESGDTRYLSLIGGTITGNVVMDRTAEGAGVFFTLRSNADRTSAMQIADINGDDRDVVRRLAETNTLQVGNGFMDNHLRGPWTTQYRLTNEGGEVTLDDAGDYVTRESGDARYLTLSGGEVTGTLNTTNTTSVVNFGLTVQNASDGLGFAAIRSPQGGLLAFHTGPGGVSTEAARVDVPGTDVPSRNTIITREKGDSRYALASGEQASVEFTGTGLSAAGKQTMPHGLGSTPMQITAMWECVVADGDYLPGERVKYLDHMIGDSASGSQFYNGSLGCDGVNVILRNGNWGITGVSQYSLISDNGVPFFMTTANWKLIVFVS